MKRFYQLVHPMSKQEVKLFIRSFQIYLKGYNLFGPGKKAPASIIVMLNNKIMHGGLVDRLKGIISGAMIAEELKIDFKVLVDENTFNLFQFLNAVEQKVVASKDEVSFNYFFSRPVLLYNLLRISKENILTRFRSKKQFHLYINMDVTNRFFPHLTEEQKLAKWRDTFSKLFKFDNYFHTYWQKQINTTKVCGIHLRFVSLLGDFDEVVNHELDENAKANLVKKCLAGVTEIMKENNSEKFIVVADSAYFLDCLKTHLSGTDLVDKLFIPTGVIGHIDIVKYEAVLQKTILDFYLLSRCEEVFQVKAAGMHNSQYCRYAAILGNAPYVIKNL